MLGAWTLVQLGMPRCVCDDAMSTADAKRPRQLTEKSNELFAQVVTLRSWKRIELRGRLLKSMLYHDATTVQPSQKTIVMIAHDSERVTISA